MAQHDSALKAMRQSERRRERNRRNLSRVRTQLKRLRTLLAQGNAGEARKLLDETIGEIDRAAKKGVVHGNAAARYKSRLARRFNALAARG